MLQKQLIREKERTMTNIAMHDDRIATIGMDLGKRSFHLIGMDARIGESDDAPAIVARAI